MLNMSKAQFEHIINFINQKRALECQFCDVIEALSPGNDLTSCFIYDEYESELLNAVVIALDLSVGMTEVLYWWLYDTDSGNAITPELEVDNKVLLLKTVGDLYDYITSEV